MAPVSDDLQQVAEPNGRVGSYFVWCRTGEGRPAPPSPASALPGPGEGRGGGNLGFGMGRGPRPLRDDAPYRTGGERREKRGAARREARELSRALPSFSTLDPPPLREQGPTTTMEADDIGGGEGGEEEFGFSRNYFLAKESGGPGKRSACKVSDIDVVDEQELVAAMSDIRPKHEKETAALRDGYRSLYGRWVFELRCGFGMLFYGFGSKKALLEDFASTALTDYSVVVINGYLPSINMKQVVLGLAQVLWDLLKTKRKIPAASVSKMKEPSGSQSLDELILFLNGPWAEEKDFFICIVVHNIDGPGLRDSDTQQCLARIAACSHARIIASIDHVNAPLLWDKKMVDTQFNWYWHHTPTFEPYKYEGMFFPLILAHGNTTQSAKTATIVLQSLTPNAQSVFRVLAEHQMAHPNEEGMPISSLYSTCRERFLVSSQVLFFGLIRSPFDGRFLKSIGNYESETDQTAPEPASHYRKTRRVIERFGDESDSPTTQSSPGANSEKEQKFALYRIACRVDKSVLSWQVLSLLCELPRHFRDLL
ncbi:hypothetical protein NL676_024960 [Syzygium grande]|nr:hypothetical protein NL676_024960 [Syzygium grande]